MKQEITTTEAVCNTSQNESFDQVLARRLERRSFLKGATVAAGLTLLSAELGAVVADTQTPGAPRPLTFTPIQLNAEDRVVVPPGYAAEVVIAWGDPIKAGAPAFNFFGQSAAAQANQFGYNCDFLYAIPYPRNPFSRTRRTLDAALLWVNHEYTNPELMFPGYNANNPTKEQVDIELAAHGGSFVAIELTRRGLFTSDQKWAVDQTSSLNRRITGETPCLITGPAAGDALLQTTADPTGTRVNGMLNNCGGGITPWGTIVT